MACQVCRSTTMLLKQHPNIDMVTLLNAKIQELCLTSMQKRKIHQQKTPEKSATATMEMFRSRAETRPFSEIPGPAGIPYLGTLPYYWMGLGSYSLPHYLKTLQSMRSKYGNVVKETRGDETIVHLFDVDDIRALYQKEGKWPEITPLARTTQEFRQEIETPLGIGNQNGEEWHRLRKKVQFLLRPKKVEEFIGHVDAATNRFISRVKRDSSRNNGTVTNFLRDVERWSVEATAQMMFDRNLGLSDGSPSSERFQKFIDTFLSHLKLSSEVQFSSVQFHKYFNTTKWRDIVDSEVFKYRVVKNLLADAIDDLTNLSESGKLRDDQYMFIRRLLTSDTPEAIADLKDQKSENYQDVLITMLSTFGDTAVASAPTVCATLYLFAKHPEKQEKCYKEVMERIGSAPNLEMGMMDNMPFMKSSIKEAMRLFPICSEIVRMPKNDLTVSGYDVPAGTMVHSNSYAILRSPDYYRQPDEFQPERWMKGDMEENTDPFKHLPFGYGPRQCAGRRISEQDMYAGMAKLIQNFKVEWVGDGELGQTYQVLMTPDRPINLKLTPRN